MTKLLIEYYNIHVCNGQWAEYLTGILGILVNFYTTPYSICSLSVCSLDFINLAQARVSWEEKTWKKNLHNIGLQASLWGHFIDSKF